MVMERMEAKDLLQLQSGSDIRGDAVEYDGKPINLTDEAVDLITRAYLYWLSAKTKNEKLNIAVGHDSRLSSDRIYKRVCASITACGGTVFECGLCSTPSIYMMTKFEEVAAEGAIMITASHHPFFRNGLKFFTADGGLDKEEIKTILEYAAASKTLPSRRGKSVKQDFLKLYCDFLIDKFRTSTREMYPLRGLKIVVDAGNGAGGFFVDRVLKPLGADTKGSQFLEPNGLFPNHIPNPENDDAMNAIKTCVLKNKADLGIIFDTDVDRAACVSSDGQEINRNKLIALISAIILEESPGATIVTDSVTSEGLTEFIAARKGSHHRFKRGYRNVINEAIELNNIGVNAPLAIETSGHAAFSENYFLDDGAYLMVRLLIKMCQLKKENKTLLSLIEGLREPAETAEIRIGFVPSCTDYKEEGKLIMEKLSQILPRISGWKQAQSAEGVRIIFKGGWLLLRMSVHDPIIPINIECDKRGEIKKYAKKLYKALKRFKSLDLTALQKYISK